MTASYELWYSDAVILLGARAVTSLLGMIAIVVGTFHADRLWDAVEGSDVEAGDTITTELGAVNSPTVSATAHGEVPLVVPELVQDAYKALHSAFSDSAGAAADKTSSSSSSILSPSVMPRVWTSRPSGRWLPLAAGGWLLWIVSHGLSPSVWAVDWDASTLAWFRMVVLAMIGITQSILVPTAMRKRAVAPQSVLFTVTMLGGYLMYGLLSVWDSSASPFWIRVVGALAVALSPHVFWFHRHRGDSYDRTGVFHSRPSLFHVGGPLLVLGWGMLWVAHNAIEARPTAWAWHQHLPVDWTSRTGMAYAGAIAVTLAVWGAGHAQDSHTVDQPLVQFMWGRSVELRLAFAGAFGLLTIATLLPTFAQTLWAVVQGIVLFGLGLTTGVQHVVGLQAGHMEKLQKWTRVSMVLYCILVIVTLLASGWTASILVVLGVILLQLGWKQLYVDRKHGENWVETKQPNLSFTVYSYGVLIFPSGLFLLAWGLSIP